MNASVFILPTSGPATYRGKYPARPRSVSHGETGLHVELNSGVRLWTAKAAELPKLADDCSAMLARAVPMTAEQYETLKAAAELLRTRAGYAGRGPRAAIEARVRAMVESIKADDSQYAKRNAEAARRETLAGETGRGFDPARPFRVRNKTPQFSGSFDFATLDEARAYLSAQVARRDCVVSGAAPVGPDSNSQCPMQSFIFWADGTETLADMGWRSPPEGERRWIAPATVAPAAPAPVRRDNVEYHAGRDAWAANQTKDSNPYPADGERAARWNLGWQEACDASAPVSPVRLNLRRQAEGMAEIAKAEQRGAIAETVSTIDMTPTWAGILPALRALIENSNAEGRRTAWAELERMAALADERNAMAARLASDAA